MCLVLFGVLWLFRKRLVVPGTLFAFYLILNGMERFLIEQIRVNNRMDFLGMHPSQAEVIAVIMILAGIGLWIFLRQKYQARPATV
jgi:prolipoprotein diacylglyceryltransferase